MHRRRLLRYAGDARKIDLKFPPLNSSLCGNQSLEVFSHAPPKLEHSLYAFSVLGMPACIAPQRLFDFWWDGDKLPDLFNGIAAALDPCEQAACFFPWRCCALEPTARLLNCAKKKFEAVDLNRRCHPNPPIRYSIQAECFVLSMIDPPRLTTTA